MQDRCRNREAPMPWLLQITRNEALRVLERRKRRGEVLSPEIYEGDMEQAGAEILVERMSVREAVSDLSDQDRQMLRLRYEDDMTQPRVAEVMGLPEGTVKVRLHRARNRLRAALGEA
jgi:RNA polymerase sigma-70 factor, ECF subfamily